MDNSLHWLTQKCAFQKSIVWSENDPIKSNIAVWNLFLNHHVIPSWFAPFMQHIKVSLQLATNWWPPFVWERENNVSLPKLPFIFSHATTDKIITSRSIRLTIDGGTAALLRVLCTRPMISSQTVPQRKSSRLSQSIRTVFYSGTANRVIIYNCMAAKTCNTNYLLW